MRESHGSWMDLGNQMALALEFKTCRLNLLWGGTSINKKKSK